MGSSRPVFLSEQSKIYWYYDYQSLLENSAVKDIIDNRQNLIDDQIDENTKKEEEKKENKMDTAIDNFKIN